MSEETITVYVTKYALTAGITRQAGWTLINDGPYIARRMDMGPAMRALKLGRDAFLTEAVAVQRAAAMAEAKLESLRAQQAKVSKLLDGFKVKVAELPPTRPEGT